MRRICGESRRKIRRRRRRCGRNKAVCVHSSGVTDYHYVAAVHAVLGDGKLGVRKGASRHKLVDQHLRAIEHERASRAEKVDSVESSSDRRKGSVGQKQGRNGVAPAERVGA